MKQTVWSIGVGAEEVSHVDINGLSPDFNADFCWSKVSSVHTSGVTGKPCCLVLKGHLLPQVRTIKMQGLLFEVKMANRS